MSIWAAIFFGIANFLLADISAKNGIEAIYPQCMACILLWICHHSFGYIRFQIKKRRSLQKIKRNNTPENIMNYRRNQIGYMSRGNSPYYSAKRSYERSKEDTPLASNYHTQIKYEVNWICFCVPIMRGLIQGWMQVVIIACF